MRTPVALLLLVAALVAAWFLFDPLGGARTDTAPVAPAVVDDGGSRADADLRADALPNARDGSSAGTRAPAGGTASREVVASTQRATLLVRAVAWDTGNALGGRLLFVDAGTPLRHQPPRALTDEDAARRASGVLIPPTPLGTACRANEGGIARFDVPGGTALRVFTFTKQPVLPADLEPGGDGVVLVEPLAAGETRDVLLHVTFGTNEWHLLVLDRETEMPIADAMAATELAWRRWKAQRSVSGGIIDPPTELDVPRTDALGRATVRSRTHSRDTTIVYAEGYGVMRVRNIGRAEGPNDPFVVRLDRAASLRGTVAGLDGAAERTATIRIEGSRITVPWSRMLWSSGGQELYVARLDGTGRFDFDGLPPNVDFEVRLTRPLGTEHDAREIVLDRLSLLPGEVLVKSWDLSRSAPVEGVVVDGGDEPINGARLALSPAKERFRSIEETPPLQTATSDADGSFAFGAVAEGEYRVWYEPRDPEYEHARPVPVTVRADAPMEPVRVVVHRGVVVRGRVLDPDGRPVRGATVSAMTARDDTDADGRFEIRPLSAGPNFLFVDANGSDLDGITSPRPIEVLAPVDDVEIVLERAGRVSGRIVDAETGAAAPGEVRIQRDGMRWNSTKSSMRGDAEFQYDDLLPASYHFVAVANDGRIGVLSNVDVRAGGERNGLVVPVGPAVDVRVHHGGERGPGVVHAMLGDVKVEIDHMIAGETTTLHLPVGTIELVLTDTNGYWNSGSDVILERRTLTLREGDVPVVEFR